MALSSALTARWKLMYGLDVASVWAVAVRTKKGPHIQPQSWVGNTEEDPMRLSVYKRKLAGRRRGTDRL